MTKAHRRMTMVDAEQIYRRHGLTPDGTWNNLAIATVLGGLEAKLEKAQAAAHAATNEYAALLIAERAENARLRALVERLQKSNATV